MNRVGSLFLGLIALAIAPAAWAQEFDLVLENGRVMDPESGLDAVRHVGIAGGKIRAISETPLAGRETIDATGLVIAPGFIDLHQHAQNDHTWRLKVRDGVTSALELEVGTDDIDRWYREKKGKLPIHYGVSIGHIKVRMRVMGDFPSFLPKADSKAATAAATPEQIEKMKQGIARGLEAGAPAVGFGIMYTPVATHWEILEMFRVAGKYGASCHVHLRDRREHTIEAAGEVIAASALTGAPLQIVHLQAISGPATPQVLQMVTDAQARGLDVTAEVYPYTAGMTDIKSAIFADGWQESFGLDYNDLQWGATGERLTEETFRKYRETGGLVIVYSNPESTVIEGLKHPSSMIASDGLKGHPRNAGTYARVLGHYVREQGTLDLMTALKKITLMPAQRLEGRVPAMKQKGRVQVGADADLTLFDPENVIDAATYTEPELPSKGIPCVIVGGTVVVDDGEIVEGVLPGQPIRAPRKSGKK